MTPSEGGWWFTKIPLEGARIDYAFEIDGSPPVPDPRSLWQPNGIHGPSRTVDHAAFSWTDQHWQAKPLSSAILYELHIGTFTPQGTFMAAIDRLDYLVDLGITHIELMPVAEFSEIAVGVDGVGLCAPHHAYGERMISAPGGCPLRSGRR
jgi:maltooligosyltrehalose trehalohydrolase